MELSKLLLGHSLAHCSYEILSFFLSFFLSFLIKKIRILNKNCISCKYVEQQQQQQKIPSPKILGLAMDLP